MQMISDVISSPCTAWVNYLNLFQSINKKVNSLKQFLQWFKKVNGFLKEKKNKKHMSISDLFSLNSGLRLDIYFRCITTSKM